MELMFPGSGAGELWPSAFCECELCRAARSSQGAEVRMGSCLLVNRRYLFDIPPGLGLAAVTRGFSLAQVSHLFVTHSHQDHLDPCILAAAGRAGGPPLHVYCNKRVTDLLPVYQQFNRFFDPVGLNLQIHTVAPAESIYCPEEDLRLTVMAAAHDTFAGEMPLIYALEVDGRSLLYACDTGWFPEPTWTQVAQRQYDVVVLEGTCHLREQAYEGHLNLSMFVEVKRRMEREGLLRPQTQFIAQHIGHLRHCAGEPTTEEIMAAFAAEGATVAYDGMVLQV